MKCTVSGSLLLSLGLLIVSNALGQITFKQPQPGDIYREYSRVNDHGTNDWRITDPGVDVGAHPLAGTFLPNPTLGLGTMDLAGATRAEAVFTIWGGHAGTTTKTASFNGHTPITIPELGLSNGIPAGHAGECYMNQVNVGIDVPLAHLSSGANTVQFSCGPQTCYSFGWGQCGVDGIIVRVYYDASKPHPTGSISSPASGQTFTENPTVSATITGSVDRVDFLAFYDGLDTDGDGVYQDYHHDYMLRASDGEMMLKRHVGTATGSPWQVSWNTDWVPDQAAGSIKILARIRGTSGIWYVTPAVSNLTLVRTVRSVRFYKPQGVPEAFWVQDFAGTQKSCVIPISAANNLAKVIDARLHVRTWNGVNGGVSDAEAPYNGHYTRLNSWYAGEFGENHFFSDDLLQVPQSSLAIGNNTFEVYSNTKAHHGVEILWPGPSLLVQYDDAPLVVRLSMFAVISVSVSAVRLQWATLSETNNYGFEVQKSMHGTGDFVAVPNGFVPGHGTTVEPQSYTFTDPTGYAADTYYRLVQIDLDGTRRPLEARAVGSTSDVEAATAAPVRFTLERSFPNPFNPSTTIRYGLPQRSHVNLAVYNALGQQVAQLVDGEMDAGYHQITFNASELPSGVYLYRMRAGSYVETKRLLLTR
jgi:hypothetical protein